MMKHMVCICLVVLVAGSAAFAAPEQEAAQMTKIKLSSKHIKAVNRPRRLIDLGGMPEPVHLGPVGWAKWRFSLADTPGNQIDSMWFCVDEGNVARYPSKVLPVENGGDMKVWFEAGTDMLKVAVEEAHKRKLEAFFHHRLNGFDRGGDDVPFEQPVKKQHPDWLIQGEGAWCPGGLWNFAVKGVRDYKVSVLREVAENYDFDGMLIDFGRHPPFLPVGQQWELRGAMTDFIRRVRLMLQERAQKRNRPYLLAVRVCENVPGCHYDGFDIETWARENLIDIILMGTRSIEVDVAGFRQATKGADIKLYPCIDDAHPTYGYAGAAIDFWRGVCANWWHQGADGIVAWNVYNTTAEASAEVRWTAVPPTHQQLFFEVGDPGVLRFKDKVFAVSRCYDSTGGWDGRWSSYLNMNPQALLPMSLSSAARGVDSSLAGKGAVPNPAWVEVYVADDVAAQADCVERLDLRLDLWPGPEHMKVKFNGIELRDPTIGWGKGGHHRQWVFTLKPEQLAVGRNLVTVCDSRPDTSASPVMLWTVEVVVAYRADAAGVPAQP